MSPEATKYKYIKRNQPMILVELEFVLDSNYIRLRYGSSHGLGVRANGLVSTKSWV